MSVKEKKSLYGGTNWTCHLPEESVSVKGKRSSSGETNRNDHLREENETEELSEKRSSFGRMKETIVVAPHVRVSETRSSSDETKEAEGPDTTTMLSPVEEVTVEVEDEVTTTERRLSSAVMNEMRIQGPGTAVEATMTMRWHHGLFRASARDHALLPATKKSSFVETLEKGEMVGKENERRSSFGSTNPPAHPRRSLSPTVE